MLYKLTKIENKSADWKIVSVKGVDGTEASDVSFNRVAKDGSTFPNFSDLVEGSEIEATLWTSPSNKKYLFPPKPASTGKTGGGGAMSKAEDKKAEHIDAHQDKKDHAIRLNQSFEWSINLAIAEQKVTTENIIAWRKWIWESWENPIDPVPF